MNEQTKKDAAQQAKPVYRELVTINGKNVVLAHNEPPVVNAGVLEMAEIFRMFNIFDEKFSPSNIDKADGTPLRLYTSNGCKVDVSKRRKHDMGFWHRNIDAQRARRISPSNTSPDSIASRMLGGYRGRTGRHHHDGSLWRRPISTDRVADHSVALPRPDRFRHRVSNRCTIGSLSAGRVGRSDSNHDAGAGAHPRHHSDTVSPPSTTKRWPLTKDASSETRKTTAAAISAGVPHRAAGVRRVTMLSKSRSAVSAAFISVAT